MGRLCYGTAMNIDGKPYRTIWLNEDGNSVEIRPSCRIGSRP